MRNGLVVIVDGKNGMFALTMINLDTKCGDRVKKKKKKK